MPFHLKGVHTVGDIHDRCLPGTRGPIFKEIRQWVQQEQPTNTQIFWLCDVPGCGKSTVAATLADELLRDGLLCAQFFFSKTEVEKSSTDYLCATLANELHSRFPQIRHHIAEALESDPLLSTRPLGIQFDKLIWFPISQISEKLVLIVDALDECQPKERNQLLEIIANAVPQIPQLRLFITSRPENEISEFLAPLPFVHIMKFQMLGNQSSSNANDITTYIEYYLKDILAKEQRTQLISQANGWFIWATTAKLELQNPENDLDVTLEGLLSSEKKKDIEAVYTTILRRELNKGAPESKCRILATLAILKEPVSLTTLREILPNEKDVVYPLINAMNSVFLVDSHDDLIHFRHLTFREFLFRLGEDSRRIDLRAAALNLSTRILEILMSELKRDICELGNSRTPFPDNAKVDKLAFKVEKSISPLLLYCSKFWMQHIASIADDENVLKMLDTFFSTKVLNWIELVSLVGLVAISIKRLVSLRARIAALQEDIDDHKVCRTNFYAFFIWLTFSKAPKGQRMVH